MKTVNGFYDGQMVKILEHTPILKNQRLIITIMDEFVNDKHIEDKVNNSKREAEYRDFDVSKYAGSAGKLFKSDKEIDEYIKEMRNDERF